MLSNQNVTSFIFICKAPATFSASFNSSITPINLSQGILIDFKGATLALDITRQNVTSPNSYAYCWLAAPPYASLDAYENMLIDFVRFLYVFRQASWKLNQL